MIKRPPSPSKLIWDDELLRAFCTYSQKRAILNWAYMQKYLRRAREHYWYFQIFVNY